jgi:hypothetical protein
MDTVVVRLSSSLFLLTLGTSLLALLSCAVGLLHLELGTPLAVLCALIVKLVVLGCDLFTSGFAVAAAAGTRIELATRLSDCLGRSNSPEFNVDLATFLLLAVGEDGVVVLLQSCLHAVEAVEFDEAGAHKLVGALVRAQTDLGRLDFGEMLFDLLFCGSVGEVAYFN